MSVFERTVAIIADEVASMGQRAGDLATDAALLALRHFADSVNAIAAA
jgi:hypothetical protein